MTDSVILHHAEPGAGESSNARNLRILKRASDASPTPRIAFYLANTYKDAGRFVEAIDCYAQRIAFGPGYRDEWLFAHLYKARMERAAGRISEAKSTLFAAIGAAPDWSEFWMELSYIYYDERKYEQSIGAAFLARGHAPPATELWRELNKYADQPLRIISWCYEHMGDIANALKWAEAARATIGLSDVEWEDRIRRLQGPADATRAQGSRSAALPKPAFPARSIALHRPGAIGDILMTLNLLPLLRNKHPGARLSYYCHPTIANAMAELFRAVGVDEVIDSALFHADAARHDLRINLIGYPLAEGYPDRPMRKHLLEYFADEMAIELPSDRITGGTILPSLELPQPARLETLPAGPYATVEVDTGWSVYREWPIDRWAEVLSRTPQMRVYQIGVHTDPKVRGACHEFMGTPLATAIRLFAHATLHLGVDSFANHLTNYTWQPLHQGRPSGAARRVRGIILWGSTQASAAGYGRNANLVSPQTLACQPCFREDPSLSQHPRGLCINPPGQTRYDDPRHQCMRNITVEQVAQVVAEAWRTATSGD
ncbi:MAG: glycosyltransferase family protein [Burkholderiales bacterium]|nr:glycosyltransferase family protein [Burkholderiales bacterium]